MIGLVLVSHGHLADEFVAALEHVVGAQQHIATVCIDAEDDIEARRHDIQVAIEHVDRGDGAIILTGMFGGTPSNLAISFLDRPKLDVIAGANLPMLVKLASIRDSMTLNEAADTAQEAGRKHINAAQSFLTPK
ncbi:MAG: PTS sugar transporter subunit IIA [Pseudomonadota bacterium]